MTPIQAAPFEKMYPQELLIELRAGYWGFMADTTGYYITIDEGTLCANGAPIYWLPPGSWQIVCLSKEVTEEVANQIMGTIAPVDFPMWTKRVLESLLVEKGLDPDNSLILKKTA
jgi:hypothetical protein